jgi:hypothetical protein
MPPPPVPLSRTASPIREKQASRTSFSGAPSVPIPPADSRRAPTPDKEATTAALFAQKREMEEMKIKMRILESRRAEDQERIKSLESKVGEADALRAARVKLQGEHQVGLIGVYQRVLIRASEISGTTILPRRSSAICQRLAVRKCSPAKQSLRGDGEPRDGDFGS